MDYWQMIGLVATGGGTLASILGVFFAVYAKQNGKLTREFIAAQNKEMRNDMREFTAAQIKESREFTAAQIKEMREFTASTLLQLRNHISQEGQKTRDELAKLKAA